MRLAEQLVDRLLEIFRIILGIKAIAKIIKRDRHGFRSRGNWLLVASWQGVAGSRCSLGALLSILRLGLLAEVNLEVGEVVVVPVFLAVDNILDTEEHGLSLKVGQVGQLDVEVESIVAISVFLLSDIVVVLGHNFRGGLPVIQGETSHDVLVEGKVGNRNSSYQRLIVSREEDPLNANWLSKASGSDGREVGSDDLPLPRVAMVASFIAAEGELVITFI